MAQTLSDLVVQKKPSGIAPTLRDFGRGYNREAVAGLLGAPVDMATTLANLLMAGGGYLGHKAGLLDQPPDLIPNNRAVGSSDWIYDRLPHQPALSNSPAEQVGRLAGALMSPPAVLKAAPTTIRALSDALQEKAPSVIDKYMDAMGAKQNAIVYHGSPHKFDKFDSSKIGTGEGAQAYGHGLYLAETQDVAKSYVPRSYRQEQKMLAQYKRAEAAQNYPEMEVWEAAMLHKTPTEILQQFGDTSAGYSKEHIAAARRFVEWAKRNPPDSGSLYTVDLPDSTIARMLDWDKPLGQQAMEAQNTMARIFGNDVIDDGTDKLHKLFGVWEPKDLNGERLYMELQRRTTGRAAANLPDAPQILRKEGIPGIRYLDGGSRSAGAGSSNFVVFPGEEGALRILERNGMPLRSQ